jgi:hypothetical protein
VSGARSSANSQPVFRESTTFMTLRHLATRSVHEMTRPTQPRGCDRVTRSQALRQWVTRGAGISSPRLMRSEGPRSSPPATACAKFAQDAAVFSGVQRAVTGTPTVPPADAETSPQLKRHCCCVAGQGFEPSKASADGFTEQRPRRIDQQILTLSAGSGPNRAQSLQPRPSASADLLPHCLPAELVR